MISLEHMVETKQEAHQISLIILTGAKNIEISAELQNRLQKLYLNKYLAKGNKISIIFYGKMLSFEIKNVEQFANDVNINVLSNLTMKINALSTESNKHIFYKITNKTTWNIYR